MESRTILPNWKRLSLNEAERTYGTFNGEEKQFYDLVELISNYEKALNETENSFYKWKLNKNKTYHNFFFWNRLKDNTDISFSKSNYNYFLIMLKRYVELLPKAEFFYEEHREKKLSIINSKNV